MPDRRLESGLYLIKQKSEVKNIVVDHYGILDIGNRLKLANAWQPIVIHQTPPRIRTDWLANTGNWAVLGRIADEQFAINRINKALENDTYDLFGNNCEHFALYVAHGKRESTQIQGIVFTIGLILLLLLTMKMSDTA